MAWGTQNRETPLRKVEGSHWEVKCLDGLANVYLAVAALVAAGTKGVEDREVLRWADCAVDPAGLTVEEREELGIKEMLPADLEEAIIALMADEGLRGLMGEEVVMRYVGVKVAEARMLNGMGKEEMKEWILERY